MMKNFITLAAFAAGTNALVGRSDSCCFHLTSSGGASGELGQLSDGQNRIGDNSLSPAQYCIDSKGAITDANGRGCILTPPTTQLQCDEGASPTSGFSINSQGQLEFQGSTDFVACATGQNGGLNVYTNPNKSDVTGCVSVELSADSCSNNGSGSGSGGSSSASAGPSPAQSTPAGSASTPGATGGSGSGGPGEGSGSSTPAPSAGGGGGSSPSSPGSGSGSGSSVPASSGGGGGSSPSSPGSGSGSGSGSSPSESPLPGSPVTVVNTITVTDCSCSATSAGGSGGSGEQPAPSASMPAPSGGGGIAPSGSAGGGGSASVPSGSQPSGSGTVPSSPGGGGGSQPSGSGGASVPGSSASSTPSSTENSCPTTLTTGSYETPHLIIPVDSSSPDSAPGTSFNGTVSSTVSSAFNFDIPSSDSGKTCSLVFLFPKRDELETSSFSFSGNGQIDFAQLSAPVDESTSFSSLPSVSKDFGDMTVSPGNSYVVSTFACPAGETVAFEMKGSGSTDLNFFQDWNPSPLGLFITTC
ncbi:unnamed protein product [Penicillium olsonii]|nr:unnamed protein product [Penicillium olsonii]